MQTKSSNIPELCHEVMQQRDVPHVEGHVIRRKLKNGLSAVRVKNAHLEDEQPTIVVYFRNRFQKFCAISLKMYQAEDGKYVIDKIFLITHIQIPGEAPQNSAKSTLKCLKNIQELEMLTEITSIVQQSLRNLLQTMQYMSVQPLASPVAAGTAQPNPRTANAGQRGGRGGGKGRRVGFLRGRRR